MKNNAVKQKDQTVTIKVNQEAPESLQVIAKSIIDLSEAFKKIEQGPLKRRTIVLLLQDQTGITHRDINAILDVAPKLADQYIKFVPRNVKDIKP